MTNPHKNNFKRYKTPYSRGFVTIPNLVITNKDLTDAGLRVLVYLLSNSTEWVVYQDIMAEALNMGVDKVRVAIKNVVKCGYVRRTQQKVNGRFSNWNYEYDSEPIFLEENLAKIEESPDGENTHAVDGENLPRENASTDGFQPEGCFPLAGNSVLPMTNKPMTKSLLEEGNDYSRVFEQPPREEALQKSLPCSAREQENAAPPKGKVLMPSSAGARKFPLKKEQVEFFNWLKSKNLKTDDDTLMYYIRKFNQKKIEDAVEFLYNEIDRGCQITNPGGFLRNVLIGKIKMMDGNSRKNRQLAKDFAALNEWKDVEFFEKYLKDTITGDDLYYTLNEENFARALQKLFDKSQIYQGCQ